MLISDCCGAPCDGIEGAEEMGICLDCGEHCEFIELEEEKIESILDMNSDEERKAAFDSYYKGKEGRKP